MRAAASVVRARAQARREHSLVLFGCARRGAAAASPLAAAVRAGAEASAVLVERLLCEAGALDASGAARLQLADALLPASEAHAQRAKQEFAARDAALAGLLALQQRRADATAGGEPQAERRRLANSRSLAVVHDVSDAEAENIFVGVVPDHDSLSKLPANCR